MTLSLMNILILVMLKKTLRTETCMCGSAITGLTKFIIDSNGYIHASKTSIMFSPLCILVKGQTGVSGTQDCNLLKLLCKHLYALHE